MAGPGNVLVTGGAGHGGSHMTRLLAGAGRRAAVCDTPSCGHAGGAARRGARGDRGRLAALVAGNAGVHEVLRWPAQQDDLEFAVRTAWTWKQTLQARRAGPLPVAS